MSRILRSVGNLLGTLFFLLFFYSVSHSQNLNKPVFDEKSVLNEFRFYLGDNAELKYAKEWQAFLSAKRNEHYNTASYSIPVILPEPSPYAENCGNNLGLESGKFDGGWQGMWGFRPDHPPGLSNVGVNTKGLNWPVEDPNVNHTITVGPGIDSCGNFPIVAPLFPGQTKNKYSARLGNKAAGWGAEQLTYTFTPDSSNSIFYYKYAVVLPSPHEVEAEPYFEALFLDENGDTIPCTHYWVRGSSDKELLVSDYCGNKRDSLSMVFYKPWTLKAIDLQAYMGQNITAIFKNADCLHGAHFGYSYLDAYCGPYELEEAAVGCLGQPITLKAPDGTGWLWSTGDTTQVIQVMDTGAYSVTIKGTDICTTTMQFRVTATPGPTANFTFDAGNCELTVPFFDSSYVNGVGSSIDSWRWFFGDGDSSNLQNPTHTYAGMGKYDIMLIITTDNGCEDTIVKSLELSEKPEAIASSGPVCFNELTSFVNNSTVPAPGVITAYLWDFGEPSSADSNKSTLQNPTHKYSSAGIYDVSLIVYAGSCTDTVKFQVAVNPNPVADFKADNPCVGDVTNFTDLSTISGGAITTWSWNFDDAPSGAANVSSDQNPTHTFSFQGSFNVLLTVTSDSGCQHSVTKPVKVNEMPVAMFSGIDVCLGLTTIFSDSSYSLPGPIGSYFWNFGDGTTSIEKNPQHEYQRPGTYDVSLVVAVGGCKDSMSIQVQVYPIPVADFEASPQPASVVEPTITFTDLSAGGTTGIWTFGDGTDTVYAPGVDPVHTYGDVENSKDKFEYSISLSIENQWGCKSFIRKMIKFDPYWTFFVPDAFSPNATGPNENNYFFAKGIGIIEYRMWIFDRWGNQIFHCDIEGLPQEEACWWNGVVQDGSSGQSAQQDVYVWVIEFKEVFNKKHKYIGHVTLVK